MMPGLDEALEGDRERQQRSAGRNRDREPARPRQAALDPGEQRGQEERRDDEGVALLDPARELRREGGDDEQQRGRDGDPRGEEGRELRVVAAACERREQNEGGERQNAEVEVELGQVVEEEPGHGLGVVGAVADDRVRAEQVGERAAASCLGAEHEHRPRRDDAVEDAERRERGPQWPPVEQRQQERRDQDRRHERHRLHAGREGDRDEAEEQRLPPEGRPLQHQHERQRRRHEERIEDVLRHHGARVGHGRKRHGEHGGEQRQRRRDDTSGQEVRGDRRERHQQGVQRLHRRVGVRQRVEQRIGGADQHRIDEAEAAGGHVPHPEPVAGGDAAGELGVDQLVDHDERADHPAGQPGPERERADHDRGEPTPRGNGPRPIDQSWRPSSTSASRRASSEASGASASMPTSAAACETSRRTDSATAAPPAACSSAAA